MGKEYKVQVNKANGQPFVNLSKKEGWVEGDEVNVESMSWGIYREEQLKEYVKEHMPRFEELYKRLEQNWKKYFEGERYKMITQELPQIAGMGELMCEEGCYYFAADETYHFDPFGDTDGGALGDITSNYHDFKTFMKCREEGEWEMDNDEKVAEQLKLLALNNAFKGMLENHFKSYQRSFNDICREFGFEPLDEKRTNFIDYAEIFTDGKVHLEFFEGRYHSMSVRDKRREYTIHLDENLDL